MRDPQNPMLTVDLFAREPLPFADLWSDATIVPLGGRRIHIASIDHRGISSILNVSKRSRRNTMTEHPRTTAEVEWRGDFKAAEEQALETSLAATPSQRLAWLGEALAFAYRVGALKASELDSGAGTPLSKRRRPAG